MNFLDTFTLYNGRLSNNEALDKLALAFNMLLGLEVSMCCIRRSDLHLL